MNRADLVQQIEQLVAAHDLYQQTDLGGQHDPDWAVWYGEQLQATQMFHLSEGHSWAGWLEDQFIGFAGCGGTWPEYLADRLIELKQPGGGAT